MSVFNQETLLALAAFSMKEEDLKELYAPAQEGAVAQATPWKDSEIDKIAMYTLVRAPNSDAYIDAVFCEWLRRVGTYNTKVAELAKLTVFCALELRDPETRAYVFKDETAVAGETALIQLVNEFYPVTAVKNEALQATTVYGTFEQRKIYVPVMALFYTRIAFRTAYNPAPRALRVKEQIAVFYQDETPANIEFNPNEVMAQMFGNASLAGKKLLNSLLVRELKVLAENTNPAASAVMSFGNLLHAKWNGLAAINRLYQASAATGRQPQALMGLMDRAGISSLMSSVRKFMDDHMLANSLSKYAPWCRALSTVYETQVSNARMGPIVIGWTYIIDLTGTHAVWSAKVIANVPEAMRDLMKSAAIIARVIIKNLQIRPSPNCTIPALLDELLMAIPQSRLEDHLRADIPLMQTGVSAPPATNGNVFGLD